MAIQSAATAANHPLIAASGGKITAQQLESYFQKHGSFPTWRNGPQGPIISNKSSAKELGWTNAGTINTTVGTTAFKASTSGKPGSGTGSVYTPGAVQTAAQQAAGKFNNPALAQRQLTADLYTNAGVLDLMAQGSSNPLAAPPQAAVSQTPGIGLPPPPPRTPAAPGPLPGRSRASSLPPSPTTPGTPMPDPHPNFPQGPVPTPGVGNFGSIQEFADWFAGQGPRMAGDLGSIYNMPKPITTPAGEYLMPGMVGKAFGANETLLPERVQAYQLQNEQAPYGPISPMLPPWLVSQAGYGPESILGGQYSLGQTIAADPSLQGVGNQGAQEWWQSQTPTGPYANFQFPNVFGQNPNTTTHLPPGTGTNYNPFPGFGQPGTNQPSGGGGQQPIPGTGTGGTGGTGTGSGTGGTGTGTGGTGTGGTGSANPFPPISIDTGTPGGGIGALTSSPDAFLADSTNDLGYLRGIASNAGYATDSTPAWQAMIDAQQRNIDRTAANLGEQFNVSGNRFSSVFGDAMTDYYSQTGLDQNALLAQMTLASQEAARGRELQAAGQLGSQGFQGASQLSNQGFQALMNSSNQAYGTAQNMFNASQNAAQQLLANSMTGAQALYGTENAAAMAEAQRQQALLQLYLGTASNVDQNWGQNLLVGGQLGMQQYGISQDQIDRLYNEFLRTQPEANPLLPYLFSAGSGYPPVSYPQFTPNYTSSLLGGLGGLMGMLGPLFSGGGNNQSSPNGG